MISNVTSSKLIRLTKSVIESWRYVEPYSPSIENLPESLGEGNKTERNFVSMEAVAPRRSVSNIDTDRN